MTTDDGELFHLRQSDGTNQRCTCGTDVYVMLQNKLPYCGIVKCTGCEHVFLGTSHEIRGRAWLN